MTSPHRVFVASVVFAALAVGYLFGTTASDPPAGAVETCPTTTTTAAPTSGTHFVSDQFTTLSSAWREVDPLGDGTVSVSSGALNLAIPAGKNHDNWPPRTAGTTILNRTLRVVQNVAPGDWTVEAKLLNADIHAGRFAGFLIEADGSHFFRSDWDGDGTHVDLYVGVWSGGTQFSPKHNGWVGNNNAVQWQRIAKTGTTYRICTSSNGTTWTLRTTFTWTPTPKLIGLNVGNSGWSPPAYTARFDYMVER